MILKSIRAKMLNRRAKNGAGLILKSLQIKQGDIIADIGSGGGYYSFCFAELVGSEGRIYAIDTDKDLLECLYNKLKKRGFNNIDTINGEHIYNLPRESCDLIFMRNVFHHISNKTLYFRELKKIIKSEGRVAIIEWSPEGMMRSDHCTPEKEILKILQAAGYKRIQSNNSLKGQSYNIFQKMEEESI